MLTCSVQMKIFFPNCFLSEIIQIHERRPHIYGEVWSIPSKRFLFLYSLRIRTQRLVDSPSGTRLCHRYSSDALARRHLGDEVLNLLFCAIICNIGHDNI